MATKRAATLLGCYRKGDAADPDTYAAAVAVVLASYPQHIVYRVTDPLRGLPSTSQFLPTVKEVRDACERLEFLEASRVERDVRVRQQLAEREEYERDRAKPRLTYPELKEKYGESWGLMADTAKPSPFSSPAQLRAEVGDDIWNSIPDAKPA